MDVGSLSVAVDESVQQFPEYGPEVTAITNVALIALLAYYEAFCRGLFAGVVNVLPEILERLLECRPDASISIASINDVGLDITHSLGFLLAEQEDFGSAKKIRARFFELFKEDILDKRDIKQLDKLKADRNLIVHHGGIITARYHRQQTKGREFYDRRFLDSLIVTKKDFVKHKNFLVSLSERMVQKAHKSTMEFANARRIRLSKQRRKAIELIGSYDAQ